MNPLEHFKEVSTLEEGSQLVQTESHQHAQYTSPTAATDLALSDLKRTGLISTIDGDEWLTAE